MTETYIESLRVSQAELSSGNTEGSVFMRLSEGSCAFLIDRNLAKEKTASKLRTVLLTTHNDDFPKKYKK
jgi:hypothetical protein